MAIERRGAMRRPCALCDERATHAINPAPWNNSVTEEYVCTEHAEAYRLACTHTRTRRLYDQRPPSEGRKLRADARRCEDCRALLEIE